MELSFKFETKQLDLPDDNKEAVYERMISERDNIAATYKAEGNSEAKVIRNKNRQRSSNPDLMLKNRQRSWRRKGSRNI